MLVRMRWFFGSRPRLTTKNAAVPDGEQQQLAREGSADVPPTASEDRQKVNDRQRPRVQTSGPTTTLGPAVGRRASGTVGRRETSGTTLGPDVGGRRGRRVDWHTRVF